MKEFLCDSVFFGIAISILAYELGVFLKKKLKLAVFNPLLISIVAVIVFLVAFHIPYESYNEGAKYLSYLLTPATVCLAIPLYEQFELLKQNVAAIFAGLISGVLTSVICVLVLSLLFTLTMHSMSRFSRSRSQRRSEWESRRNLAVMSQSRLRSSLSPVSSEMC